MAPDHIHYSLQDFFHMLHDLKTSALTVAHFTDDTIRKRHGDIGVKSELLLKSAGKIRN